MSRWGWVTKCNWPVLSTAHPLEKSAPNFKTFSARLRDETDLEALNDELVGVVKDTMQSGYVALWLRPETASRDQQEG
jgi:hypothetical protein